VKQIQTQNQQMESHTVAIGTAGYAPGEQISGMPRLNSDIYALGIIAIQALTGLSPKVYRRDVKTGLITIPTVSGSGEPVSQDWWKVADTTQELTQILNKMVHLDFTQRYQSAVSVLNDINRNVR
ncbi:MAG: serine/threonine protein kinase, partial [Sphaerospermopsis kisseleviana]